MFHFLMFNEDIKGKIQKKKNYNLIVYKKRNI